MFKKACLTRKDWRKNRGVVVILTEIMVVFQVRVRQLDRDTDIDKEFEKIDEEVADEVKAATKKMEDAVKRQLKKAGMKLSGNSVLINMFLPG